MGCNCGSASSFSSPRTIGAPNGAPPVSVYVTSPWFGLRSNRTYASVTGTAVDQGVASGYLVLVTESVPG